MSALPFSSFASLRIATLWAGYRLEARYEMRSFDPIGDHKAYMTQSIPVRNTASHDHRYILVDKSLRTIDSTSQGTSASVSHT